MATGDRAAIQLPSGEFIVAVERTEGRPGTGEPMYRTRDYIRNPRGMGETHGTADYLASFASFLMLKTYKTARQALEVDPLHGLHGDRRY